jgi:hypothetical protein
VRLATILQRKTVGKRLGNRLDRELVPRIAHLVEMPVAGGDANAEKPRIDFG